MIDQKMDPLKAWKEVYDQTEKFWGKTLNETLKSEEYSAWTGSVLDLNVFYQKMLNDITKGYLEKMNMPTQEDISRIASLIINLENKVDNMEDLLEDKVGNIEQSSGTKRDMTKMKQDIRLLENKVDQVLEHLQKQQELLAALKNSGEEKQ